MTMQSAAEHWRMMEWRKSQQAKDRRAARKAAGTCWRCGEPAERGVTCNACRLARKLRDAGITQEVA